MFDQAQLTELSKRDKDKKLNSQLPLYIGNSQGVCRRDILVQWVIQQSQKFEHSLKTLELAVIYIDTYLNIFNIEPEFLELLGISAYSMASKFNETEAIGQIKLKDDFGKVLYEDQVYNEMEVQLLQSLDFQLNHVTPSDYLIEMGISINESISSLIMFVLMDFEIYKHSQIVLAFAIFNFQQEQSHMFTDRVKSVTKLINNKLNKAKEQFNLDKTENDETRGLESNLGTQKKIYKKRQSKKLKQLA
ncbi:unnamed protein product (macronuclear) [Paramecium tetraurelia]|uniref:Cyclin-like domain-containing protein n=1 Tax=Paramecium tetraurelia TaxID=5888 RepID=A0BLM4_PARTE|nr:uncharacterized protein GSPATT00030074001 [Paramecium tetraurelia]CAK59441.1 unnamed protein product [Paramecium tetraurelia]|eukprot:XP_001426839.1 hypothetical protein (macronuclear) [Paramecium tetraurelia strain d4-2]